jgi:hypothetical protein
VPSQGGYCKTLGPDFTKEVALTVKNGIYKIPMWSTMLSAIAPTRNGFFQTGKTNKLSFSDREFIALNISTVTNIERLIVVARCDIMFVNISHPISGNSVEH